MQENLDVGLLPVEARLLVADVLDRQAGDVADPILGDSVGPSRLTRNDHLVRGGHGFAGHTQLPGIDARLGSLAKEQVDDLVRNTIADLVGMSFRDRLASEQVGLARHSAPHCSMACGQRRALRKLPDLTCRTGSAGFLQRPGLKRGTCCSVCAMGQAEAGESAAWARGSNCW